MDSSSSEESEYSAPTFSPIISRESQSSSGISGHIGSDHKNEDEMNQVSDKEEDSDDNPVSTEDLLPLSEVYLLLRYVLDIDLLVIM